jgi:hypothetical protein|uniref:Uncharacterized protein n=1 Tax=Picea glauca TaxID=3330 RepID=A0A101LXM4_PICGL|nr:hypothetical protein ABT39_MTgene6206 [Picea glauca]QHR88727.1 hypothetical protein Q903MT_gene2741 [Picea sitchensis]
MQKKICSSRLPHHPPGDRDQVYPPRRSHLGWANEGSGGTCRSLPPLKGMSQQLFGYIEPSHQPNSKQLTGAIDSRAPTGWRCIARLACYAAPVTTLYFETGPFKNIGNAEEVRNLPVRNY